MSKSTRNSNHNQKFMQDKGRMYASGFTGTTRAFGESYNSPVLRYKKIKRSIQSRILHKSKFDKNYLRGV